MYLPTLGRFLSRDPLQNTDLLSDNNWFGRRLDSMASQAYAYASSNPVNTVDPSGLQAVVAPGNAANCEDCQCLTAAVQWDGRDVINVPGRRKCRVVITCQQAPCDGLPGMTGTPELKQHAQGQQEWVIPICVQCGWQPINYIIEHELVHALQFCRGESIRSCTSCKRLETQAHKANCKLAFPNPSPEEEAKYDRCYMCGVNISCKRYCGNVVPYPQARNCQLSDLGVGQNLGFVRKG